MNSGAATSFRSLGQRIQGFIERRFFRHGYDGAKTLEALAATARYEVALNQLTAELVRVIQEPEQVVVWLAPVDGPTDRSIDGRSRESDDRP